MRRPSSAVPIVGGHTNLHSPFPALAAAVLGRARRLLTSFDARPGDDSIAAVDLRGQMHGRHPFWNAAADAPGERLRGDYAVLPWLAEEGLARAGKDISMGGIVGTALMLLEASGVGGTLSLDTVPAAGGRALGVVAAGVPELRISAVDGAEGQRSSRWRPSRRVGSKRRWSAAWTTVGG